MQSKNLYIATFGCQMNVNDSERIVTMLQELGYRTTEHLREGDLVLFNTCTVRGGAEDKVHQHLANLKSLKKKRPGTLIGIAGCVAQQEGDRLLADYPWLDLVVGTHNLHLLPEMVREAEAGRRRSETDFLENDTRLDLFPAIAGYRKVSAFVTVMQGCDNFCSYCIVPYVRGREISRRFDEILREVRELASQGVREVVLLGQNVNSYGMKGEGEPPFSELVREVARVPEVARIRFVTSHPKDMSPELIACFGDIPKLCGALHLPAQSGNNRILAAMNRGYSRERYLETVRALRAVRPDIKFTGDMIVGFPAETEAEFEETLSLMEEVRYFDLFSFVYSPRPGTKAAELADDLSKEVKLERLDRLQKLQSIHSRVHNESYTGTIQQVLVEGPAKREGQVMGRCDSGRIVNLAGSPELIGCLVNVRIVEGYANSLLGELL
ncbi:tRNA (N6-isopentenyl adenosine(37)-C2)-methylthiotransferase MiaB [Trichlorobacter ammonificans]|uniref:tRNA-2-methylthio-N(6)-dimethylallyladenosine synthase n=1 Tax=Trichlorobacter ammonificans TaxID=2916410 RepID=A0ABM9D7M7_9BACT|nr:tRNA (N6-isopentenyl adenosine(37)-C2)-methylthiotransferase MiaB [Trichlorobacter ammonificans]CAH2031166.1 tRNA-2-methylthio-N(6)-dimethylallyladenosine synthase [Trichlorobacter ammonificans]